MTIVNIKRDDTKYNVFIVTFKPNWLERLFGVKEQTKRYYDTGKNYWLGDGRVYLDENKNTLGNGNRIGEAIDKFRMPNF